MTVLVPFIFNCAWRLWGWVSSSHTAFRWGCPTSLSPFISSPPRLIFGPQAFALNGQSLCFLQLLVSEAVGCGCCSASLPMPLAAGGCASGSPLKQFFCSLSRQQSLLTSLCSYLGTCCQLLSAHNQLRWIMLQWAANLHVTKLVPQTSHSKRGPLFSGSLTCFVVSGKVQRKGP